MSVIRLHFDNIFNLDLKSGQVNRALDNWALIYIQFRRFVVRKKWTGNQEIFFFFYIFLIKFVGVLKRHKNGDIIDV